MSNKIGRLSVHAFFYYSVSLIGFCLIIAMAMSLAAGLLFHEALHKALFRGIGLGLGLGTVYILRSWPKRWKECSKCSEKQEVFPSSWRWIGWKCENCGVTNK